MKFALCLITLGLVLPECLGLLGGLMGRFHQRPAAVPKRRICGNPKIAPSFSAGQRIIGGQEAIPNSWPWEAWLYIEDPKDKDNSFLCGGSLINDQWVMTAGHCLYDNKGKPKTITVALGVHDRNAKDSKENQRVVVVAEQLFVHPKYDNDAITNDIALIKLSEPITFTDEISPICLPDDRDLCPNDPRTTLIVAGWGMTHLKGESSHKLREVAIPVISKAKCKDAYRKDENGNSINGGVFCAGNIDNGRKIKGTCAGDSGSPVVAPQPEGHYQQVGLVSWGHKDCETKHPGSWGR
jgi:secreted trypsin-like serine protease